MPSFPIFGLMLIKAHPPGGGRFWPEYLPLRYSEHGIDVRIHRRMFLEIWHFFLLLCFNGILTVFKEGKAKRGVKTRFYSIIFALDVCEIYPCENISLQNIFPAEIHPCENISLRKYIPAKICPC